MKNKYYENGVLIDTSEIPMSRLHKIGQGVTLNFINYIVVGSRVEGDWEIIDVKRGTDL